MRRSGLRALLVCVGIGLAASRALAGAGCADDLAACLGAAAGFDVVTDVAKFQSPSKTYRYCSSGECYRETEINPWETGAVCALSGSFQGHAAESSRAGGTLVLRKNTQKAGVFKVKRRCHRSCSSGECSRYCDEGCGIQVGGDPAAGPSPARP